MFPLQCFLCVTTELIRDNISTPNEIKCRQNAFRKLFVELSWSELPTARALAPSSPHGAWRPATSDRSTDRRLVAQLSHLALLLAVRHARPRSPAVQPGLFSSQALRCSMSVPFCAELKERRQVRPTNDTHSFTLLSKVSRAGASKHGILYMS